MNFSIFQDDVGRSARVLSHSLRREAGEERLVWLGAHPPSRACCPIERQQVGQMETIPDDTADQGEETGEAMRPVVQKRLEAQQHVEQEGGPDLPAHSVGTVTEEVAELQGLLDLLEEDLDLPTTAVEIGDGGRSPLEIVGEKLHLHLLAVEFDQGGDATQTVGVFPAGLGGDQHDLVVAQDFSCRSAQALFDDPQLHVHLGPGDPEDAADEQAEEVGEVDVGPVEDDDLPGADAGADLAGTGRVIVAGGVDDGEARQEALEVQPEVALGGGLAPPVLGPIQTRGNELNGGGVDHMDDALEATGQAFEASPGTELRLDRLQMGKHRPEELLGHRRVAMFVSVRESVAAGRGGAPDARQPADMVAQGVAHVVEADRVGQLGVEHGDHVAPSREGPGLGLHPAGLRQFSDEMAGDEIAKLGQDTELASGWGCPSPVCFFHTRSLPRAANLGNPSRLFSSLERATNQSRTRCRLHHGTPGRPRTARRDRNGLEPAAGPTRRSLFPRGRALGDHRHPRITPRTRLPVGSASDAQAWHLRFRLQQPRDCQLDEIITAPAPSLALRYGTAVEVV